MIKKRKICFVINSRANYGRVRLLIKQLKQKKNCEVKVVLGGSSLLYKFGNISKYLKKDGIKISAKFYSIIEGEGLLTMTKTAGSTINELANIFFNLKPDLVIVLADRYENLPVAICASYMNIPLAHIQGGEVTGSIDEKVRHAITKLSDIHLVATERARNFVIRMGENPKMVFNTGCPSLDIAKNIKKKLSKNFFEKLGVGTTMSIKDKYIVVIQHPVTTEIKESKFQIEQTIKAIKNIYQKKKLKIVWFWPNVDAGTDKISLMLRKFREKENPNYIRFVKNMSPEDYLKLIMNSECLVGNSSSGIREGSYLGVPYVNIGNRQANREKYNNVINVDHDHKKIFNAIIKQIDNGFYKRSYLYGNGNSSKIISNIISKIPLKYEKIISYI
jgi:UDP-hydrolysing UDP-N-acetyl-D-glucosamine 2-epimerase